MRHLKVNQMKGTKVSIIMAVYNAENYVVESVQSALSQTHENLELIICNDGSKDKSMAVLSAMSDRRIKIIENESNLGVSETRNRCLQITQGDFIAILDSDDIWNPEKLEKQLRFLQCNPKIAIVGTQVTEIDLHGAETGERDYPLKHRAIMDFSIWACPFLHSSILVRKEAMLPYRTGTKQAEDWELEYNILARSRGANLAERLVQYRVHNKNLTNSRSEEQRNEALKVVSLFPEISGLSSRAFKEFKNVFNYRLSDIQSPLRAIFVLSKIWMSRGFQNTSAQRLKWVLSYSLKQLFRR